MARLRRLVLQGQAHRLRLRGHNGQAIVLDQAEAAGWGDLLRDVAVTHRVAVHAWSLHSDRFDLVATPQTALGLSRMMQSLARRHAAAYNRRHGRSGTLWDGRYQCCLLDPNHWLLDAMLAVEGLSEDGSAPIWGSSRPHHLGQVRDPMVTEPAAWWALGNTPFEREAAWQRRITQGLPASRLGRLEAALRRGWPLGEPAFLDSLPYDPAVKVAPRARGRPPKSLAPAVR